MEPTFKFYLGAAVMLSTSVPVFNAQRNNPAPEPSQDGGVTATLTAYLGPIERGNVIARTEHAEGPPQYLVRYRDGSNCQREEWFFAEALADDPEGVEPEIA